jgi:soluble lytic murein transglycosylase-like protein
MKISTLLISMAALLVTTAQAGQQRYEPMSASVRAALSKAVSDTPVTQSSVLSDSAGQAWLAEMSKRLTKRFPDENQRNDFLKTVYYEATRAGLDPELVLGLIEVESGFKKYAVSSVAARGYMQVMPFWTQTIGSPEHDLFHLRTNLRYGCNILRLYIDMERGDLYRALGRYNGSLGKPEYPNMVLAAWKKHWDYTPREQVGGRAAVQSVKLAGN